MTKAAGCSGHKQKLRKMGDEFSIFFHDASKKKKTDVFIKAAEKANKDQRDLVKHVNLKFQNV